MTPRELAKQWSEVAITHTYIDSKQNMILLTAHEFLAALSEIDALKAEIEKLKEIKSSAPD